MLLYKDCKCAQDIERPRKREKEKRVARHVSVQRRQGEGERE